MHDDNNFAFNPYTKHPDAELDFREQKLTREDLIRMFPGRVSEDLRLEVGDGWLMGQPGLEDFLSEFLGRFVRVCVTRIAAHDGNVWLEFDHMYRGISVPEHMAEAINHVGLLLEMYLRCEICGHEGYTLQGNDKKMRARCSDHVEVSTIWENLPRKKISSGVGPD